MGKFPTNNSKLICSFDGCGRKVLSKGWCSAHYKQVVVGKKDPKSIIVYLPIEQRLYLNIDISNGCWLWKGSVNNKGYGIIGSDNTYVHRLSFEIAYGIKLSKNQEVCHKCDIPNCINPEHLFIGTHSDNMIDMAIKGRSGNKKLSDDEVKEIRILKQLYSYKELSEKFGVSKSSIKDIIHRRNYDWLK